MEKAPRLRPFDAGAGLPPAEPGHERAGRVLCWAATLLLGAVGLWEIGAPFGAGHYAAATAVLTSGENFWRFWTLAPLPQHPLGDPSNSEFYCHHPFGVFWTAGFFALLGHHDWVCRLPAVLLSAATPGLIYVAGRALFGPLAAGLSALAFAVLPITLSYANFFALEVPAMFGMALAIAAFVRFAQSGEQRFAVLFVIGTGYAMAVDWPGFVFAGLLLGWLFVRGFVLKRHFRPLHFERFATTWATTAGLAVALALFHVAVFNKLEKLDEFLRQGEFRSAGNDAPLAQTLARRSYWIALAFTPLGVLIGKLGAALLVARAALEKRDLEVLPLLVLGTAAFQYLAFKQGADIHFFWPQYFALYFAYAFGALSATLERIVRFALPRLKREATPRRIGVAVLALGALPLSFILHDGLTALCYARKSGGRFNEKGLIIHADFDKSATLAAVARELPEDATLGVHPSMKQSYWMDWVVERPVQAAAQPRVGKPFRNTHYVLDLRFTPGGSAREFARDFKLQAYGPFLVSDLTAPAEPLAGFALMPREPGFFERLFVSSNHALYAIAPDAFVTWELRGHFGQEPNPPPTGAPVTREQLRIAYNLTLERDDSARAAQLYEQLLSGTDRSVARRFRDGVELLAARFETGASDFLTLYFRTSAPLEHDRRFTVSSEVEAAPRFALTPKDSVRWDVGMPFSLPTSLWQPGFIYTSVTEIVRRPGRERYTGAWSDGEPEVVLLTLD